MPKFLIFFLIVIVLLAGLTTYKLSQDTSFFAPIKEGQVDVNLGQYDFQNWHEFAAPQGKFKVLLPALPQHAIENVKNPQGEGTRKYEMYVSQKNDGTIYMISIINFSDPKVVQNKEQLLRQMMQDMIAANSNNDLKQVHQGDYKGFPALDYSFANPETHVDAKTFIVDDTLYMLTRVTKTKDADSKEFDFFVNSFDLPQKTQMSE